MPLIGEMNDQKFSVGWADNQLIIFPFEGAVFHSTKACFQGGIWRLNEKDMIDPKVLASFLGQLEKLGLIRVNRRKLAALAR